MNNIKEDKTFEVIEKNINDLKISWVSIFEIKKGLKDKIQNNRGINDVNYTFEFVASSNADYESGLGKNIIIPTIIATIAITNTAAADVSFATFASG